MNNTSPIQCDPNFFKLLSFKYRRNTLLHDLNLFGINFRATVSVSRYAFTYPVCRIILKNNYFSLSLIDVMVMVTGEQLKLTQELFISDYDFDICPVNDIRIFYHNYEHNFKKLHNLLGSNENDFFTYSYYTGYGNSYSIPEEHKFYYVHFSKKYRISFWDLGYEITGFIVDQSFIN